MECARFVDSIAERETSKCSMHREWIQCVMEETVCGHRILAVRFLAAEKRPGLKKLD
jgi:hypothetical protein